MWKKNQKKKATRIDTLVGQATEVTGDIKFSGGLHVDGTIKGNVYADNDGHSMLQLSEQGTIEGEVKVPFVVVNGVVVGDVYGNEHVELQAKAKVAGNVYYNLIEMAIGAEVNGKLVHSPVSEEIPLAISHNETDALDPPMD